MLNSGHRCNGQAVRLVGEDHDPRAFSTFCPTVIAAIGRLPSTLEDRSVSISMRRALPNEMVIRFDEKERSTLLPLARKARRWTDDHKDLLRNADPKIPEELHGRAADNWRPFLAVAHIVGGQWFDLASDASVSYVSLIRTCRSWKIGRTERPFIGSDDSVRGPEIESPRGILINKVR